jgi:hypothetical protein
MLNLWKVGIPATPSGGSYIAGALRVANELRGMEGNIVTMIFDSLEFYKNILGMWVPRISGCNLDPDVFDTLRTKVIEERAMHVKRLREGENELYNSMMERELEEGNYMVELATDDIDRFIGRYSLGRDSNPLNTTDSLHFLRFKVPGGFLNSKQLRGIAELTRSYSRSQAEITNRQDIQLHWIEGQDALEIFSVMEK